MKNRKLFSLTLYFNVLEESKAQTLSYTHTHTQTLIHHLRCNWCLPYGQNKTEIKRKQENQNYQHNSESEYIVHDCARRFYRFVVVDFYVQIQFSRFTSMLTRLYCSHFSCQCVKIMRRRRRRANDEPFMCLFIFLRRKHFTFHIYCQRLPTTTILREKIFAEMKQNTTILIDSSKMREHEWRTLKCAPKHRLIAYYYVSVTKCSFTRG